MATALLLAVLSGAFLSASADRADAVELFEGPTQRVNSHGTRLGASQGYPDVSGNRIVWWDNRGTSSEASAGITLRSKDLSTRDEVVAVALNPIGSYEPHCLDCAGEVSVSGNWVAWTEIRGGQLDVFARELPDGPEIQVTNDASQQYRVAIDGTTVVWTDYRNSISGADIYKKDLATGVESAVTTAPGYQDWPSVSGGTVVWVSSHFPEDGASIWGRTGSGSEFEIFDGGPGGYASSPSVSGNRAVWALHSSEGSRIKTCIITEICSVSDVEPSSAFQGSPDISGNVVVWVESGSGVGPSHIRVKNLGGGASSQVDSASGYADQPATNGQVVVWRNVSSPGSNDLEDIYYRPVDLSSPARRVNSVSMGSFGRHNRPAASGSHVLYNFSDPEDFNYYGYHPLSNPSRIARTFIAGGASRDFMVSSFTGRSTSGPRLSGTTAVWRDFRNCSDLSCSGDIFEANPFTDSPGSETALPLGSGQSARDPDIDGSRVAWRCKAKAICVRTAGTTDVFDLSSLLLDTNADVDEWVRISGDVVVWVERTHSGAGRIHALKADPVASADNVLGTGVQYSFERSPQFDIDGSRVVWIGGGYLADKISENTIAFPCSGSACDRSSSATAIFTRTGNPPLVNPSVGGTWTAWEVCCGYPFDESDIYVMNSGGTAKLITPGLPSEARFPYIDVTTNRIYWEEQRHRQTDIFIASLDGSPLPALDTTPPGPVSSVTVTPSNGTPTAGSIELDWTNPGNSDLAGVKILRKSGPVPPAWLDDPIATVVFDGTGTNFVDGDVVNGVQYSYSIYAYDHAGNHSSGAFAPNPQPLAIEYTALSPGRLLDTRPTATTGSCTPPPCATLSAGGKLDLQVTGEQGVPASGVSAVALNVTAVEPTQPGFLTVYPTAAPPNDPPLASNLNFSAGQTMPNLVKVKIGVDGKVTIYNGSSGLVDVVVDVAGWYSDGTADPPAGGRFQSLAPARLLDTRASSLAGSCTPSPCATVDGGQKLTVQITGHGGVPASGVSAAVLNVTVTQPAVAGYLTVYPTASAPNDPPNASNLNFVAGQTVPNLAITKVGTDGKVTIFNGAAGPVAVVFDVAGWFSTSDNPVNGGSFGALSPTRIADTRPEPLNEGGHQTLGPGQSISVQVTGRGEVPSFGVSAAVLNVTVTNPSAAGFLTVYPEGENQPLASNLNFVPGLTVPNLVLAKLGVFGIVRIFNGSPGTVDVVVDVGGWYANTN